MNTERWQRVKEVFEQAVRARREERASIVYDECRGDDRLASEVLSLLEFHEGADAFLEPPERADIYRTFDALETDALVGRRLGPYRLLRLINSGGMGHVYLAERADGQFEKRVAIKVIRRSMATPALRRRFEQERHTLAALDHPHITRLLDGGVTPDGLSYLVMEHVDGLAIDEYCDRRRLGTAERLELFRQVCGAVHFAHQRLIIHRDLKPSNILVTEDGTPKLLDFGLAKLLDDARLSRVTATVSAPLLTPEYASPEQLRGGEPITTATDVYSLGVVLYELLTGRRPYRLRSRSPHEIVKAICEVEPPRPSTTFQAATRSIESVSPGSDEWRVHCACESRATDPADLRRRLTGDLDAIILMALRKEPLRRYGSVEQFSEDIRRHLVGLPVVARKGTHTYRAGKFIRRNRMGVLAAAVVLFAFIAGIIGTSVALVRVNEARQKAQLMNEFLQGVLAETNVLGAGRELTLREVLDRAAEQVSQDFADHPDIRSSLQLTIGQAYVGLRLLDAADRHFNEALQTRRELFGERHPQVAEVLHQMAILSLTQGDLEEAESRCRRALDIRRRLGPGEDEETAGVIGDLGVILKSRGRFVEAEPFYRESLAITERLEEPDGEAVASALNNLGVLLKVQGRLDEAEPLFERALTILRSRLGNRHVQTANVLSNLANLRHAAGQTETALALLQEALAINRSCLPPEHPRIAIAANNLASVLQTMGRYREAEPLFLECLAIHQAAFGADHERTATSLHNLGILRQLQDRHEEAERLFERALSLRIEALGRDHPLAAITRCALGRTYLSLGRTEEAIQEIQGARKVLESRFPEGHVDLLTTLNDLSDTLRAAGRLAEAEQAADEAIDLSSRLYAEPRPQTALALVRKAKVLSLRGEPAAGEPLLREALEIMRSRVSDSHPNVGEVLLALAENLAAQRRPSEAEAAAAKALEIALAHFDEPHGSIEKCRKLLIRLDAAEPEDGAWWIESAGSKGASSSEKGAQEARATGPSVE